MLRWVEFRPSSIEIFLTEVAGIMAPGVGDTSNWNTSVHMPELSIGPVQFDFFRGYLHEKYCSENPKNRIDAETEIFQYNQ